MEWARHEPGRLVSAAADGVIRLWDVDAQKGVRPAAQGRYSEQGKLLDTRILHLCDSSEAIIILSFLSIVLHLFLTLRLHGAIET